ncbi:MAG: DUF4847 family protein [Prevotellaceae bacterium]|nr:DUF4847 family protein [Candidatus Minthosoma caballi]
MNKVLTILITAFSLLCFCSCANEDDIDELFIGKTWYMNGASINGKVLNDDVKKFFTEDGASVYKISFTDSKFTGTLSKNSVFSGRWEADPKKQTIRLVIEKEPDVNNDFDRLVYKIIKNVTKYKGDTTIMKLSEDGNNYVNLTNKR